MIRSNVFRLSAVAMMVSVAPSLFAQDDGGMQSSEGTAKVLGLRFVKHNVSFDVPKLETYTREVPTRGYRGLDDFFNVREANSNIRSGQWQFELEGAWSTFRSGSNRDDNFTLRPSLKYAYTDNVNIEFGFDPINFGDGSDLNSQSYFGSRARYRNNNSGDDGNGDTSLKYFWQMSHEQDIWPAMAMWLEARLPTGEGSSKVDGTLNMTLTKTLCEGARGHIQGFVKTANGARGDLDRINIGDRRDFQWGIGTGFDYSVTENDLVVLNYMNSSSEYTGNSTNHAYEAGWVHHLGSNQQLMFAVDYNDNAGGYEPARWGGRFQWSMSW